MYINNICGLTALLLLTGCTKTSPSLFTIENEQIRVQVSAAGAELRSIRNVHEEREYLWQADSNYWSQSSPILFPVIGRSYENAYLYDGVQYHMPQHGFAMNYDWLCVFQGEDSLAFEFRANEETRKLYPFDFVLDASYKIRHNRLAVYYQVRNEGNRPMPFVIGGHPGFNCPIGEAVPQSAYALVFEKEEFLYRYYLANAIPDSALFLDHQKSIPISKTLFESGAVILKNPQSSWVGLQRPDGSIYLKLHIENFPYLTLWTSMKEEAHFICLEPWMGLPGQRESLQQITDKEGAIELEPGEAFATFYEIEVGE
ncbi:MAG: aldose 1-epimerase family protein [Bacteroidia bacterium]